MEVIKTYADTKCELEVAKTRLNLLSDRKEQLYCKYFPITKGIKEEIISGGKRDNDKMAMYVYELNEVDIGTGRSLAQEIEHQKRLIENITRHLQNMSDTLGKMTGIEYALFYEIVYKGVNITQAVRNISQHYDKDERTVWKYHYNKIKNDVKKL